MTVTCSGCGANVDGAVAQSVVDTAFAQKNAEKKRADELAAQLGEVTAKAEGLSAAASEREDLAKQLEALKGEQQSWGVERAFLQNGLIDQEGIDVARFAYDRMPADARPEIGEWLQNRDALPRAVQAYLQPSQASPAPAPPVPAATKIDPNNGVVPTSSAPETFPAGSIKSMDLDAYRQHRDSIIAAIAGDTK